MTTAIGSTKKNLHVTYYLKSSIFPFLRENVGLPKKIVKIFLKFSFIVALHVYFLLQIGILRVKGIRKHAPYLEVGGPTPAPPTRKKEVQIFLAD